MKIKIKQCDGGKFVKRTIKSRTNLNGGELDMIDGKKDPVQDQLKKIGFKRVGSKNESNPGPT